MFARFRLMSLFLILTTALLLAGCGRNDEQTLLLLTNQDLADNAEIERVDFLPEPNSYYAFAEFTVPEAVREEWLFLSYRSGPCTVFENLQATSNLRPEWEVMLSSGNCYENKVLIRNPLASYNELSVLVNGDRVLLYAAGVDDPAFFL